MRRRSSQQACCTFGGDASALPADQPVQRSTAHETHEREVPVCCQQCLRLCGRHACAVAAAQQMGKGYLLQEWKRTQDCLTEFVDTQTARRRPLVLLSRMIPAIWRPFPTPVASPMKNPARSPGTPQKDSCVSAAHGTTCHTQQHCTTALHICQLSDSHMPSSMFPSGLMQCSC